MLFENESFTKIHVIFQKGIRCFQDEDENGALCLTTEDRRFNMVRYYINKP